MIDSVVYYDRVLDLVTLMIYQQGRGTARAIQAAAEGEDADVVLSAAISLLAGRILSDSAAMGCSPGDMIAGGRAASRRIAGETP